MTREAKIMWMGKDGRIHYVDKEKLNASLSKLDKSVSKLMISGVIMAILKNPEMLYAATNKNEIMEQLWPIVKLLQDLAEPVCYGFLTKGFLKYSQGKEEEGKTVLKYASGGYLGIRFVPQIVAILNGINIGNYGGK